MTTRPESLTTRPLPARAGRQPARRSATGAERLLDTLVDLGVDTVFGYPGGAVLPLYDALHGEPRLRHILVRHEQAAVHAAEGYARSTGRLGVVLRHLRPRREQHHHGPARRAAATRSRSCASAARSRPRAIGTDAFQECDAIGISRPVTKWNVQIRAARRRSPRLVRKALSRRARRAGPGPVLIDFPKDLQQQPVAASARRRGSADGRREPPPQAHPAAAAAHASAGAPALRSPAGRAGRSSTAAAA